MRLQDAVRLAGGALSDRKVRAALTIIGIIIGPATIVALVGATQGYSNASAAQFQKLGTNTIFVSSASVSLNLTQSVVNKIQGLQDVTGVVPYDQLSGTITVAGQSENVEVIATDIAALQTVVPALSLQKGTVPSSSDVTSAAIGASVAYPDVTGAKNVSLDQVISVSISSGSSIQLIGGAVIGISKAGPGSSSVTRSLIVTGIYNKFGQGLLLNPDSTIFVPLAVGETISNSYSYTGILVSASSAGVVNKVVSEITSAFANKVSADTVSTFLSLTQSISQATATLLLTVAGVSVLVAFIGIMTTMFTTVLERTKEIGIMKALGASGRNIMLTFLSEALLTGFLGGLGGAAAGSALSFLVVILLKGSNSNGPSASLSVGGPSQSASPSSSTLAITPVITPELILFAIVLASAVGMLAGLYPAWRASKMPPVDALRSA